MLPISITHTLQLRLCRPLQPLHFSLQPLHLTPSLLHLRVCSLHHNPHLLHLPFHLLHLPPALLLRLLHHSLTPNHLHLHRLDLIPQLPHLPLTRRIPILSTALRQILRQLLIRALHHLFLHHHPLTLLPHLLHLHPSLARLLLQRLHLCHQLRPLLKQRIILTLQIPSSLQIISNAPIPTCRLRQRQPCSCFSQPLPHRIQLQLQTLRLTRQLCYLLVLLLHHLQLLHAIPSLPKHHITAAAHALFLATVSHRLLQTFLQLFHLTREFLVLLSQPRAFAHQLILHALQPRDFLILVLLSQQVSLRLNPLQVLRQIRVPALQHRRVFLQLRHRQIPRRVAPILHSRHNPVHLRLQLKPLPLRIIRPLPRVRQPLSQPRILLPQHRNRLTVVTSSAITRSSSGCQRRRFPNRTGAALKLGGSRSY
mmetsp:Transcript_11894/g.25846  ORF Transcript_11894/g.25846 Transcript_11894/m.25846 type:complete len:424 (-) Transcript_11894:700-1971(-)